jgi:hypothetical protein
MHSFSTSLAVILSKNQASKPGDASLDDDEMHSLFSASPTPPGTLPSSETQNLEPGDTSDNREVNTEISSQQDEPPWTPSRASANRPASHSPVSNIKPATSAFAAKVKTSYSLTINKVTLTLLQRIL